MLCATALQSGQTTLPACAAKQVISSPWGAPLLGLPKPVADSHAKDAPRQIPSNFRTSPSKCKSCTVAATFVRSIYRGFRHRRFAGYQDSPPKLEMRPMGQISKRHVLDICAPSKESSSPFLEAIAHK